MITLLLLIFAIIHLSLLISTFFNVWVSEKRVGARSQSAHQLTRANAAINLVEQTLTQHAATWRLWFLRALLFGMCYDNFTVALGNWFIDESWYKWANFPRFYIHVLILPFLTLFTMSLVTQSNKAIKTQHNASSAQGNTLFLFSFMFTFAMLAFGIYHEIVGLQLTTNEALGFTRYSKVMSSPPMATIFTNLFTIALSIILWRKANWKILTLGASFIFVINAASAAQSWGFLAGNLAEIVFVVSLLMTQRRFSTAVPTFVNNNNP